MSENESVVNEIITIYTAAIISCQGATPEIRGHLVIE